MKLLDNFCRQLFALRTILDNAKKMLKSTSNCMNISKAVNSKNYVALFLKYLKYFKVPKKV